MKAVRAIGSLLLASALAVGSPGLPVDAQKPAAEQPDLSGPWKLNPELSEDAREKIESMRGSMGGGRGGGRGGGLGRGGFGGGGLEEAKAAMQEAKDILLEAPTTLAITQAEGVVTVTDQDGRPRTFYTDDVEEEGDRELRARWENARLVTETSLGRGPKVVETYELEATSGQLIVNVQIEGRRSGRGGLSVRRVYDSAVE